MDINELPSPQFVINETGMISVFLPAFEGEPSTPTISKKDQTTLHFQRSPQGDVLLTNINEETMLALADVKKILVIETNVLKGIDLLDKALSAYVKSEETNQKEVHDEIMDTIERAYEVTVQL